MSDTITRRERREQQRRQRHRRPNGPSKQRAPRRINGLWIAAGIVVLGIVLVFGAQQLGVFRAGPPPTDINLGKYNLLPGEVLGQKFADEGNSHIPAGQKVTYNTNPPTSGSHWSSAAPPAPVPWGIKDSQQANEAVVHNLEHGGVVIFWKGLTDDEVNKLKDLVRLMTNNGFKKIVLEPYAEMPSDARIAVSAWDWGLKLQAYDDVQIVKFVKSHYDGPDAPERGIAP